MVDIFLTIVAAVVFILVWGAATYILAYYSHPLDNQESFFPKIIVVLALSLAVTNVLMLPLDVASRNSTVGQIPMDYLWLALYILIAVVGIFLIPFAIFYYEAEDDQGTSQVAAGFKWGGIITVVFIVLLVVGYFFLGVSNLEVSTLSAQLQDGDLPPSTLPCDPALCGLRTSTKTLSLHLNVFVWIIAVLAIGGWVLFALFGGIGLIALPFDLITSFLHRPLPITKETYNARKIKIGEETEALLQAGMAMTQRGSDATRKDRNMWKKQVYILDREFIHNEIAYKKKGGPTIIYYGKLVLGILSAIVCLLLLLQIVLWTNLAIYPFLDFMFIALDGVWTFFGTIFFALFAFYLIIAVIKGRELCPLRSSCMLPCTHGQVGKTFQNSFLINMVMVLLSSVAILHFLSQSFKLYVRVTAVNAIFNVAVNNLRGVFVYWLAMKWVLVAIVVLTIIFFIVRPQDQKVKKYMKAQRGAFSL